MIRNWSKEVPTAALRSAIDRKLDHNEECREANISDNVTFAAFISISNN
jgi:hypothetical protein